jgi:probable phosphoglycerate mutase
MSRAVPCLREIVSAHLNQSVFVVSHKATNRIVIGYYLGIELPDFRNRIDQQPACLNILDFRDLSRARLMLLNDVSHYEGEPDMAHVHLSPWWANEFEVKV